jgi:CelD/BcsL family acetyltransferase involved in cellulose biosynthesis
MSEVHHDHQEALEAARLRVLVAETGVRVMELAVLLSAVEAVARRAEMEAVGGVPREELPGVPDPAALLSSEEDITTAEAVRIVRDFLDMSDEGEARLRRLL